MTNKWTVNGVEAPEGAEFYADNTFWKSDNDGALSFLSFDNKVWIGATFKINLLRKAKDYRERPTQPSKDYAFCLSEAINKLKHCADVAPDDKRKDALLEIVDEVEFIKSEGEKR